MKALDKNLIKRKQLFLRMGKRVILGLTANVTILGKRMKKVVARIDTGATSSSIDKKLAQELELGPIIRSKIVKSASGIEKRPVVHAQVKFNVAPIQVEFSLANRNHLSYPVLLGQDILKKGNFLIDPNK